MLKLNFRKLSINIIENLTTTEKRVIYINSMLNGIRIMIFRYEYN